MLPATAADLRHVNLARALRTVHTASAPLTRADLGRRLGCVRATVGALVADLDGLGLVREATTPATGRRGRPSASLGPAPAGPVVVTVEIAPDGVRVAGSPLTGGLLDVTGGSPPAPTVDAVFDTARRLLQERVGALGRRVAGVAVAVHGQVDRTTGAVLSAPGFGWTGPAVDVRARLGLAGGPRTHVGNVATLVAVGEAVRGRARGVGTVVALHAAVGLGGALLVDGRAVTGRRGLAGEYGHAPFGVANLPCRCGASGCWETEVDRLALARAAGVPADARTAATVAADLLTDRRHRAAVVTTAAALGRGIGALVVVHDPDLVLLTGHAADLYAAAPDVVDAAVAASGARHGAPPVEAGTLGADAGLVGAAETVFDPLLDDLTLLTTPWRHP